LVEGAKYYLGLGLGLGPTLKQLYRWNLISVERQLYRATIDIVQGWSHTQSSSYILGHWVVVTPPLETVHEAFFSSLNYILTLPVREFELKITGSVRDTHVYLIVSAIPFKDQWSILNHLLITSILIHPETLSIKIEIRIKL
jgi:hypothetical protein